MNKLKISSWDTSAPGSQLFNLKKRILWIMVVVSCIVMIPLTIKNFLFGHNLLAVCSAAFLICLLIDATFIHFTTTVPIHYSIVVFFLVAASLLSIIETGLIALFWVYPVAISLIFALPSVPAIMFNTFLVITSSIISYYQFGIDITLRFTPSLIITLLLLKGVLNIMEILSQKLKEESIKDPLTGVLNRRQLNFYLNDCIEQNNRFETHAAIILFDIDNFKTINDKLGHSSGDLALKMISNKISQNTRKTDLFFRIGGDEFLLLARYTPLNEAGQLANKICEFISKELSVADIQLSVSVGVSGITTKSSITISNSDWMENADKALYQAKEAGRNCVEVYTHFLPGTNTPEIV